MIRDSVILTVLAAVALVLAIWWLAQQVGPAVIAYDLEADFDAVRSAVRTGDPAPLQANPDPQETGILLIAWAMHELLGADANFGCGVPHRQCHACDFAWSGDDPCWLCGREPEHRQFTGWGLGAVR